VRKNGGKKGYPAEGLWALNSHVIKRFLHWFSLNINFYKTGSEKVQNSQVILLLVKC